MLWKQQFFTVLILLIVRHACYADGCHDEVPYWRMATNVHTGFVITHHNNMHILTEHHPRAFELFLAKRVHGEKDWHSFYGYPEYGASLIMFDFGSPSYIGKSYGLYPFMNFFLCNSGKHLNISVKVGAGAAYVEKIFDRHTNFKNVAIGSHINALLSLQFNAHVRITNDLSAFTGIGLTHFSNGAFKMPNAGLNILTLNAGFGYTFGDRYPLKSMASVETPDKKWCYRIYLSGGVKEISPVGGEKYLTSGFSLEMSRKHLPLTRFGGTFDLFYDTSDYHSLRDDDTNRLATVKAGLAAGYELAFGRLSVIVQAGIYLRAKYTENGMTYQRMALRYAVNSKANIHFGLKNQLGQADYLEISYGYRIR